MPLEFLGVDLKVEKSKSAGTQYRILGQGDDGAYSIHLRNASSGMQTATPIGVILQYYATKYNLEDSLNSALLKYFTDNDDLKNFRAGMNVSEFPNRRVHIFIEEPELSLYPDNQTELVDFLIEKCFGTSHNYTMTLMMASHSPYIVNYLNLLMARNGHEAADGPTISPDDVNVYLVECGTLTRLNMTSDGRPIINTRILSDPIAEIYARYNRLSSDNG